MKHLFPSRKRFASAALQHNEPAISSQTQPQARERHHSNVCAISSNHDKGDLEMSLFMEQRSTLVEKCDRRESVSNFPFHFKKDVSDISSASRSHLIRLVHVSPSIPITDKYLIGIGKKPYADSCENIIFIEGNTSKCFIKIQRFSSSKLLESDDSPLQAKLRKMHDSLEKAKCWNRRYQSDCEFHEVRNSSLKEMETEVKPGGKIVFYDRRKSENLQKRYIKEKELINMSEEWEQGGSTQKANGQCNSRFLGINWLSEQNSNYIDALNLEGHAAYNFRNKQTKGCYSLCSGFTVAAENQNESLRMELHVLENTCSDLRLQLFEEQRQRLEAIEEIDMLKTIEKLTVSSWCFKKMPVFQWECVERSSHGKDISNETRSSFQRLEAELVMLRQWHPRKLLKPTVLAKFEEAQDTAKEGYRHHDK
ncbi:hypothetical protein HAX54_024888 [Datura stramonium]|uniref:Uncharacterized protein n=1 Tax=Datura stramonium TaxID=4076 RepID=A0ABS8S7N8_DATST|nr:hypothetical protein [Datura stramonium]